jgi:Fe-S oxidoreductase
VIHYTELLEKLLAEGKLSFTKSLEKKVAYHDPCYLGPTAAFTTPPGTF